MRNLLVAVLFAAASQAASANVPAVAASATAKPHVAVAEGDFAAIDLPRLQLGETDIAFVLRKPGADRRDRPGRARRLPPCRRKAHNTAGAVD